MLHARNERSPRRHRRPATFGHARLEALEARRLLAVAPAAIQGSGSVAVGDFNRDGIFDVAATGAGAGAIATVRLGIAGGTYHAPKIVIPGGTADSVATGDLDGDGKLDLVAVRGPINGQGNSAVITLLGRGDGQFALNLVENDPNNPTSAVLGDLNGDGKPDLAMTTASGKVEVRIGNGDGTFGAPQLYDAAAAVDHLAIAPFNGDGKADIVATSRADGKLSILFGPGDGTFPSAIATDLHGQPTAFALGDFNGDGKLDVAATLAAGASAPAQIEVFLNQGFSTVLPGVAYALRTADQNPTAIVAGDLDGDGKLDLAALDGTTGNIRAWHGQADGTFASPTDSFPALHPLALGITPPDSNGVSALIVPDQAGGTVRIDGGPLTAAAAATLPATIAAHQGTSFQGLVASFAPTVPGEPAGDFAAVIAWGDGTYSDGTIVAGSNASSPLGPHLDVTGTHTYLKAGSFSPIVSITKLGGAISYANDTATAAAIPIAITTQDLTVTEGQDVRGVAATFTDPSNTPSDQFTATINWGGSVSPTPAAVTSTTTGGQTVYSVDNTQLATVYFPKPGDFPATLTLSDKNGRTFNASFTVHVQPAVVHLAGLLTNIEATQGQFLSNVVLANFTTTNPRATTADFKATIDGLDVGSINGTVISTQFPPTNGQEGYTLFTVLGSFPVYATGSRPLTINVTDLNSGVTATATTTLDVAPLPLTIFAPTETLSATERSPLTNQPLVLFQEGGNLPTGTFTATIDWGDGSLTSTGAISTTSIPHIPELPAWLMVQGSHTFRESGTYTVQITVRSIDGQTQTATRTIAVADLPINLAGGLDAASDSGKSSTDGITNVQKPTWNGTSEPGSTVGIVLRNQDTNAPTVVGYAVANAQGAWSITASSALSDGSYSVIANAVDAAGKTTASAALTSLVIDTVGPRIVGTTLDPRTGRVTIFFQDDRAGLDTKRILNAASYALTPITGSRGVYSASQIKVTAATTPKGTTAVSMIFHGGRRLARGQFVLSVASGAASDIAGNALDGGFHGTLPTGDGHPGTDFAARYATNGRMPTSTPLPIVVKGSSTKPRKTR